MATATGVAPKRVEIPDGPPLRRLPAVGWTVGLAGAVASILLGAGRDGQLAYSALVACLFVLSVAVGGLLFVLVQFLSRAGWSVVVRRLAEHLMATLPVIAALLLVVLAWGLEDLFSWARGEPAHGGPWGGKHLILNRGFFFLRAVVYLGLWSLLGWWFRRQSLRQDATRDPAITRRLQRVSAPALVVFGLTVTFAAFDWIMSLEPEWYSTIFGVYFFSGSAVAVHAFLVLLVVWLRRRGPLSSVVTPEHLHDLGKLLFAFTVFWAYIAFSQFLLIWYGNLPEETVWYTQRLTAGWRHATWALALGHFVLPFFFLLPRKVKRNPVTVVMSATWMLAMHYLDLYWLVMPSFHREGLRPTLLDLTTLVAVGGMFLGSLGLAMRRSALVPTGDPRLAESLSFENV
jgi:hypothetical protein